MQKINTRRGLLALSPIIVLLTIYLAGSIIAGDFYRIPIATAFIVASIYAVAITRGTTLDERIENFSKGAANTRIMYMIWIFVLAGAFAALAKAMGAVDATVQLTLNLIPSNYLPAGIFIAACFISLSIGTSVGTIVALTPVVTALATKLNCDTAWLVAIVVGGAFFGDNLSFISDTTIAATQTQGCSMRSKFRTNIRLVLPAAIVTLLLYAFSGNGIEEIETTAITASDALKCIPYLTVIVCALIGMNVLLVLIIGIIIAGAMGIAFGAVGGISIFTEMGSGIMGMTELILVTMLAGGLLEIVRINGGIDYLIRIVTLRMRTKRAAEFAIASLTALANICTANNTIAILTVGDISRDISKKFGIQPRRAASIMDTTSCFVQGVIPYGAQLLIASGLAKISPLEIIPSLYYPMCIGVMIVVSILVKRKVAK
ncbi:MAG: Na+/H+ antiporter NhaC family protein [Bacteroidaceae bacterium]|nr:Na+/H+ antiporter NhaC family protein [Bacteroidaceae bacterium]